MPNESFSIDCRNITVTRGQTSALKELSFSVEEHAWVYVMGPSGGGKTTLLRAIAGLESLSSGEVHLAGQKVSDSKSLTPPHERRVAMVFQEPPLWPHLTVEANIALPLANATLGKQQKRERVHNLLSRLGIAALAQKHPGEISGGEARRTAIAQALITRPRVLLLDEPTNHLDLHLRAEVMSLLRNLHASERLTTICVTHQPEPPLALSDRVMILEAGRAIHDGPFSSISPEGSSPFVRALHRYVNGAAAS